MVSFAVKVGFVTPLPGSGSIQEMPFEDNEEAARGENIMDTMTTWSARRRLPAPHHTPYGSFRANSTAGSANLGRSKIAYRRLLPTLFLELSRRRNRDDILASSSSRGATARCQRGPAGRPAWILSKLRRRVPKRWGVRRNAWRVQAVVPRKWRWKRQNPLSCALCCAALSLKN